MPSRGQCWIEDSQLAQIQPLPLSQLEQLHGILPQLALIKPFNFGPQPDLVFDPTSLTLMAPLASALQLASGPLGPVLAEQ